MRIDSESVLGVTSPDLRDRRGDLWLLVWSHLGQWICGDSELVSLIDLLDGTRTIHQVVSELAANQDRPRENVVSELSPVLEALVVRGLLETGPRVQQPEKARFFNVTLNITNRCNLSCSWCYNAGGARTGGELAAEAWTIGLRRVRTLCADAPTLFFLGGEPLLAFESLMKVIASAQGEWVTPMQITTNGTLIEPRHARELAGLGVETQVSIDAGTRLDHDKVRGDGNFDRAVRGVKILVDHGVPTVISMVYTRRSIAQLEEFLDFAKTLGVRSARFIPLRMIGKGIHHASEVPDQWAAFKNLLDILARRPDLRPLVGRDYFSTLLSHCAISTRRCSCGVGSEVLFIDADGTVYPCPNHVAKGLEVARLTDADLLDRISGSQVLAGLRESRRTERMPVCAPCKFRHWCAGDCRGEALARTGDRTAPSVHCAELKRVYLEAFWLLAVGDERFPALGQSVRGC